MAETPKVKQLEQDEMTVYLHHQDKTMMKIQSTDDIDSRMLEADLVICRVLAKAAKIKQLESG